MPSQDSLPEPAQQEEAKESTDIIEILSHCSRLAEFMHCNEDLIISEQGGDHTIAAFTNGNGTKMSGADDTKVW